MQKRQLPDALSITSSFNGLQRVVARVVKNAVHILDKASRGSERLMGIFQEVPRPPAPDLGQTTQAFVARNLF